MSLPYVSIVFDCLAAMVLQSNIWYQSSTDIFANPLFFGELHDLQRGQASLGIVNPLGLPTRLLGDNLELCKGPLFPIEHRQDLVAKDP